jgi:hypothetical protein
MDLLPTIHYNCRAWKNTYDNKCGCVNCKGGLEKMLIDIENQEDETRKIKGPLTQIATFDSIDYYSRHPRNRSNGNWNKRCVCPNSGCNKPLVLNDNKYWCKHCKSVIDRPNHEDVWSWATKLEIYRYDDWPLQSNFKTDKHGEEFLELIFGPRCSRVETRRSNGDLHSFNDEPSIRFIVGPLEWKNNRYEYKIGTTMYHNNGVLIGDVNVNK